MDTYGPWRIWNAKDMKHMATLIVAMTLIASEMAAVDSAVVTEGS